MKKFSILLLFILLSCSKDDDNSTSIIKAQNLYTLQLEDGTIIGDEQILTVDYFMGREFK